MADFVSVQRLQQFFTGLKTKFLGIADTASRTQGIPYGVVDSTSTSTAFTATVAGVTELKDGTCLLLKNGVVTSAAGFTININNLGAKPVYSNMAATTAETTIFNINYTLLFIYDSTRVEGGCWINYRGYYSDANSIGYQLRGNGGTLPAADKFVRYRLLFTSADGSKWVPANTSTSTNATASRTVNQTPINPFGRIVYYGTTTAIAAGANPGAAYLWSQYQISLGYSFNLTGAALVLQFPKPLYIKAAPQANGSAIIDSTTPYVQALPSTADGKIYIFLGIAYSATNIELYSEHPVYYHDGTGVRKWPGVKPLPGDIPIAKGDDTDGTSVKTCDVASNSVTGTFSIVSGKDNTLTKNYAAVFGRGHTVSGSYALVAGYYNTVAGQAYALGQNAVSSGTASFAAGQRTEATADCGVALGLRSKATSTGAFAEGMDNVASGISSHAEGRNTTASGAVAHVEGYYTVANHAVQHVGGRYNVADPSEADASTYGTYAEIIGNGTGDDDRSNARTLDWSGNEVLSGKLTLGAGPTGNMDAATKQYVDQQMAGAALPAMTDAEVDAAVEAAFKHTITNSYPTVVSVQSSASAGETVTVTNISSGTLVKVSVGTTEFGDDVEQAFSVAQGEQIEFTMPDAPVFVSAMVSGGGND